jgi:hypothetical protein
MGSFHTTCNISQLPILPGDKVRVLFLLKSIYAVDPPNKMLLGNGKNGREGTYSTDFWVPWNIPLKAVYDDYGRVRDVEEGPNLQLFHACLREMLAQVPQGENPYHDPATVVDMDWEQMWWAAQEGRLRLKLSSPQPDYPDGLPLCAVMIREDIWQAMFKVRLSPDWYQKSSPTVASISKELLELIVAKDKERLDKFPFFVNEYGLNQAMRRFSIEASPLQRGLGTFLFKAKESFPVDSDEMKTVIRSTAELCYIGMLYNDIRRTWHPGTGLGSQGANFETTAHFHHLVAEVAYRNEEAFRADDPEAEPLVRLTDPGKLLGKPKKGR